MKTPSKSLLLSLTLGALLLATGCADEADDDLAMEADTLAVDTTDMMTGEVERAVARLEPTAGNDVRGTVAFAREGSAIRVTADVTGLSEGLHGIHVHEFGDCSAPDATSAGGHFAPQGSPHGAPDAPAGQRHVGDLGNIEASSDGMASYVRVDSLIAFTGPNDILGKAVVIHSGEDDLTSQPTGDAGDRLACGVIQAETGM